MLFLIVFLSLAGNRFLRDRWFCDGSLHFAGRPAAELGYIIRYVHSGIDGYQQDAGAGTRGTRHPRSCCC